MFKTVIFDKKYKRVLEPREAIYLSLCLDFSTKGKLVVCRHDSKGMHNVSKDYSAVTYNNESEVNN